MSERMETLEEKVARVVKEKTPVVPYAPRWPELSERERLHLLFCPSSRACVMQPKRRDPKRVVVIIHEVRGVTENLVRLASFLTSEGFSVVLPSLYSDGYVGSDEQAAYRKFYSEVGVERASGAISDIIDENVGAKISLLGFSVGATIAWLLSGNGKIDSAIGFYGSRIRNHLDIQPSADVDLYFCRERGFDVEEMIGTLNAKQRVSAGLIPGEHGFYSTLPFTSPEIERANRLILMSLKR